MTATQPADDRSYRTPTGTVRVDIGFALLRQRTHVDIETELWNTIEYYSEIEEVGIDLVKRKLPAAQDYQHIFKRFQAFVRQGKSYYTSAKTLHYRSSSLLYYYSFLNLAKSWLVLKDPSKVPDDIHHGLMYRNKSIKDFTQENIIVKGGVYPLLYEAETMITPSNNQPLNIVELMGYCFGIGYQYQLAGFGTSKIIPCLASIMINITTKEAWVMIGIPTYNVDQAKFEFIEHKLASRHKEISLDPFMSKQIFGMETAATLNYRFFEQKFPDNFVGVDNINVSTLVGETYRSLYPYIDTSRYDDKSNFRILLPYEPVLIPMSELLAIYGTMFYLSSLVRYRPEYLEELLEHKPAWLIESFVTTMPDTFLRIIVSKITGTNIVFTRI